MTAEINELSQIAGLANSIGVPGLLGYAVWYFKKEIKEYRIAHAEEIKLLREEHKISLSAQREAHMDEKINFFSNLKEGFAAVVEELKQSREERNKILNKVENSVLFENDISLKLSSIDTRLAELKAILKNKEIK